MSVPVYQAGVVGPVAHIAEEGDTPEYMAELAKYGGFVAQRGAEVVHGRVAPAACLKHGDPVAMTETGELVRATTDVSTVGHIVGPQGWVYGRESAFVKLDGVSPWASAMTMRAPSLSYDDLWDLYETGESPEIDWLNQRVEEICALART